VSIYAPGKNIVSAVYDSSATSEWGITLANDPRNSNYKLGSISGTSMAGPQVTGCLACLLEQQPTLTHAEALLYLISSSKKSQIASTGGAAGDYTSLGSESNNRYLFYKLERQLTGNVSSQNTYKLRSATGAVYPRVRVRSRG
jgi:subtilisin family serine protease